MYNIQNVHLIVHVQTCCSFMYHHAVITEKSFGEEHLPFAVNKYKLFVIVL